MTCLLFTQCQLPSTGTEVFTVRRFSTAARSLTGLFQKIWIGIATPTVSPLSGATEAFSLRAAASVLKSDLIGTVFPSLPFAVPVSVYFAPGFSSGLEVHSDFSAFSVPSTVPPLESFSVTSDSSPPSLVTVTGWSGRTAEAPLAGTTLTFAAAGSSDGVVEGAGVLVDEPGVLELVAPGELDGAGSAAFVSLHAVPTSSIVQIPATARPCFRTVLLNT